MDLSQVRLAQLRDGSDDSPRLCTGPGPSGSPYNATFVLIHVPKMEEDEPHWPGSGVSDQGCEFLYFSILWYPSDRAYLCHHSLA